MIGRVGVITDTGRRRRHNEDAYVCEPPLFAIADGMGGPQAGEVASRLAAAALRESGASGGGQQRIADLIQEANRRVYDRSNTDPHTSGMGTTITVALVDDGTVAFGHVGDSRAYLIRSGGIEQITEDHSLVNELLKTGKLSPEEAHAHPQKSVITRALGTDPDVDADTFTIASEPGDVFLLCSDGLTNMVDEDAILELLQRDREDLDAALRALVRAANRGGGEDNITVVAFEITEQAVHDGKTQEQAVPSGVATAARASDDEDTLDEADAVPTIEEPSSVDEGAPKRHRRRRALAWLVLVVFALAVAALLVWRFLS
jgi:PPM family protein phosphatase